jgi:hypothetical protein
MTCITHEEIHLGGYSFVDDTYIVESENANEGPHVTAVRMQGGLDIWDGGIGATGGASQPAKSFWYLVPDSLVPKLHIWSENMESILVVKQA